MTCSAKNQVVKEMYIHAEWRVGFGSIDAELSAQITLKIKLEFNVDFRLQVAVFQLEITSTAEVIRSIFIGQFLIPKEPHMLVCCCHKLTTEQATQVFMLVSKER